MIFFKNIKQLFLLSICFSLEARIIIKGDSEAQQDKSFSFNVFPSASIGSSLYVGRSSSTDTTSDDTIRQYSLSGYGVGNTFFLPLALPKVTYNGVADVDNPLIGQKILTLGTFKTTPIVVCNDNPSNLYWISSALGNSSIQLSSIEGVKDAQGLTSAGILKAVGSKEVIFAGVKKSGGLFGEVGGGIALLYGGGISSIIQSPAVEYSSTVKAVPLDGTQNFLVLGSTPTLSSTILDMYWDDALYRLYIVFQATGGNSVNDGAIGIAMGYPVQSTIVNQDGAKVNTIKLLLRQWISKDLINSQENIVGGLGANTVASLKKVRVLHATTGPSYLIVVGNSSNENNNQTVFALPLVDKKLSYGRSSAWASDSSHGVLASKVINPGTNLVTFYNDTVSPGFVTGRAFQVSPTSSSHLTVESDAQASVGCGPAIGSIQDIVTYKDAVFISTTNGTNEVAGVFYSQALFDVYGAIKGWTPWKRIISAPDSSTQIFGIFFDSFQGRLCALQGASSTAVDTVISSTWSNGYGDGILGGTTSDGSVGLNYLLQDTFKSAGGLLGLFDFPKNTVGFSTTLGQRTSLMIATGYKKIVLIEIGQDNNSNYFIPRIGNFLGADNKIFTSGSITESPTSNTYLITMSGGELENIGAITSAAICKETVNGYGTYIVIGGTGGLAVLRSADGSGSANLQKSFNGINNFSWVTLGSYKNIRKLWCDGQNIYVLTPTTLDRIELSQLHENDITAYTIADAQSLLGGKFSSFSDVVISGDFALIATNSGLYTTGVGGIVSTATTAADPLWRYYPLSEGPLSVTRLSVFSSTNFEYDIAKNSIGGQIDVLAASVGQSLASLYRLTVADATGGVTSTTLQSIPDGILYGVAGPYVHLGDYKNYYTTDGAVPLVTRSSYLQQNALLQALPVELQIATPFTGVVSRHVQTIPLLNNTQRIAGIVRNSAVGSNIVVTNNGLQILE